MDQAHPIRRSVRAGARSLRARHLRRSVWRRASDALGMPLAADAVVIDLPGRCSLRVRLADGRFAYVKARRGTGSLEREAAALALLSEHGIPTTPLLAYDRGAVDVLVTAAVEGEPLRATSDDDVFRRAGAFLRRMHEVPDAGRLRPFDDVAGWGASWSEQIEEAMSAAQSLGADDAVVRRAVDAARDRLGSIELTAPGFVHGDCRRQHLLMDAERMAVLDLDVAGTGDPRFDLAVVTASARHRIPALLEGYGGPLASDPDVLAIIDAYQLAHLVKAVPWVHAHRLDVDGAVEDLRAAVDDIVSGR